MISSWCELISQRIAGKPGSRRKTHEGATILSGHLQAFGVTRAQQDLCSRRTLGHAWSGHRPHSLSPEDLLALCVFWCGKAASRYQLARLLCSAVDPTRRVPARSSSGWPGHTLERHLRAEQSHRKQSFVPQTGRPAFAGGTDCDEATRALATLNDWRQRWRVWRRSPRDQLC